MWGNRHGTDEYIHSNREKEERRGGCGPRVDGRASTRTGCNKNKRLSGNVGRGQNAGRHCSHFLPSFLHPSTRDDTQLGLQPPSRLRHLWEYETISKSSTHASST